MSEKQILTVNFVITKEDEHKYDVLVDYGYDVSFGGECAFHAALLQLVLNVGDKAREEGHRNCVARNYGQLARMLVEKYGANLMGK